MFMQYKFQIIKLDRVVCQGQEMSRFQDHDHIFPDESCCYYENKKRVLVKFHMIFKNW